MLFGKQIALPRQTRYGCSLQPLAYQGVRVIDFNDSDFFGPMRSHQNAQNFDRAISRINDLASEITRINRQIKGYSLSIKHVSARVDTIFRENERKSNTERLKAYDRLKSSGLKGVYLGIESGSKSQLKRYCKGSTVKENAEAIRILREIGLNVEVGFIFFDALASLDELWENILFIEKTKLYETNSRLFGSLRIQTCVPYFRLAKRHGLIGRKDENLMAFSCLFKYPGVAEAEAAFAEWEKTTRKLIKLVSVDMASRFYQLDFLFMKEVIHALRNGKANLSQIASFYSQQRDELLRKLSAKWGSAGLRGEFLSQAIKQNGSFTL